MLYMFLVLPPLAGRGMAAMSAVGSSYSFLALVMALFMVGYVVRVADRLTIRAPALAVAQAGHVPMRGPAPPAAPAPADTLAPGGRVSASTLSARPYLAPRCAALCKIAMGLTMAYMLVLML